MMVTMSDPVGHPITVEDVVKLIKGYAEGKCSESLTSRRDGLMDIMETTVKCLATIHENLRHVKTTPTVEGSRWFENWRRDLLDAATEASLLGPISQYPTFRLKEMFDQGATIEGMIVEMQNGGYKEG